MKFWLLRMRTGRLLVLAAVLALLLSEALASLISYIIHGYVCSDALAIGAVAALSVTIVVVVIVQLIVRDLQRTDERLLEQTLFLDSILQSTGDLMIIALDTAFRVKYLNTMAERVLGVSAEQAHEERLLDLIEPIEHGHFEEAIRAIAPGRGYDFQFNYDLDNRSHYFEATLSEILHTGQLAGYLLVAHDTTDRKQLEETLLNLSYQDGLTGIANRRRFDERLEQEWRRAIREHQPLTLVMVDIDYFKNYNDLYGHPAGDDCLKKIARVLLEASGRPGDVAARYGGEEFASILPNTTRVGAEKVAEQIRSRVEGLEIPHAHSQVSPWVTVSVGVITHVPTSSEDSNLLLEGADRALYKAKQQGRNRVVVDHH